MSLQDESRSGTAHTPEDASPSRLDTVAIGTRWSATKSAKTVVVLDVGPVKVWVQDEGRSNEREMLKLSLVNNYRLVAGRASEVIEGAEENGQAKLKQNAAELTKLRKLVDAARTSNITTVQIKLTPALAQALLATDIRNRRPDMNNVLVLARDMSTGHWQTSHQGLGLGPSLELGDGQHRCLAVIKSGATVQMVATVYHNRKDFDEARKTWDVGRKRTKAHVLELGGYVAPGRGKRVAAILESVTHLDKRWPYHPTNEETVEMFMALRTSISAVEALPAKEFLAPTCAAFLIAHLKAPTQVDECIRLVTAKVGYAEGSAAHCIVLRMPDLQRAKGQGARVSLMKDALSLLYKHVKGHPAVTSVKNNEAAYKFFLGDNMREGTAGR